MWYLMKTLNTVVVEDVYNMKLCSESCKPCCDFCIHCIYEKHLIDGKEVNGEPIGCSKHADVKHQMMAEACGHCEDFHCFNVKE